MSTTLYVFAALLLVTSTLGHSQMRCAKYNKATGVCLAPIRDSLVSFEQEDNNFSNGGGICQTPMSNPISAKYANGDKCGYLGCPDPMGSIAQGETFTIMWLARNHAVADQTPGTIALYVSPVEAMNQGVDVSTAVFEQNKICEAPFISCDGQNGNFVQCYADCKMPTSSVVGAHTLWWKWTWKQGGSTTIYTTCADVYVTAGSGSSTPAPTPPPVTPPPVTPAPAPVPTPVPTPSPVPVPVPAPVPSTTGKKPAMTTGAKPVPVPAPVPVPVTPPPVVPTPAPTPVPVPPTSTPSTSCTLGQQVCVGTNQYRTCTNGREANYWADAQTCNVNTSCHPSTNPLSLNKIYCY